jgi:predicted ester cyclase
MQGLSGPRDVVGALVTAINAHDPIASRELGAFPDLTMRVARWLVDGNVVVTEEVMEATHRGHFAGLAPTGRRVRLPMVHLTTVAGDRIAERVTYHDTAGVLRQLALPAEQR